MGLNWTWTDKMGEVLFMNTVPNPKGIRTMIYQGNALMIWVDENPEDNTYTLNNFASDFEHLKNMLGLNSHKGYEKTNLFNTWNIKEIRLNTRYKSVQRIVELLARAKTDITITLYHEEEGTK